MGAGVSTNYFQAKMPCYVRLLPVTYMGLVHHLNFRSGRRQAGSRLGRDALHMLIMCWPERAGHAPSEAQTIVVRKWSRRPGKKTRVVVSQQVCMNLPNTAHERLPDFLTDLIGVLLLKKFLCFAAPHS